MDFHQVGQDLRRFNLYPFGLLINGYDYSQLLTHCKRVEQSSCSSSPRNDFKVELSTRTTQYGE